ncbi:DASH complex, subunit Dad2, partial [Polychaeton citri CBS 116435]
QQTALQRKIEEKKVELESLKQLHELSTGLVGQMEQLEEKLSTLSNGTEAVAAVLGNWGNVLGAIHMASVKIPRPQDVDGGTVEETGLPQTLVRIPIQQAEEIQ